uniref:X-C motif chemokine ligand 1 n=1 Tax=Sus scrofa TaxID=9823 RepID=A0A8D0IW31_PIG
MNYAPYTCHMLQLKMRRPLFSQSKTSCLSHISWYLPQITLCQLPPCYFIYSTVTFTLIDSISFLFSWFSLPAVGSEVLEKSICVSLTTRRLPVKNIKTYTIKEGSMKAVIFITRRGLKVCADPHVEWVKKAVQTIDKSNRGNQAKPTGAQQTTNTAVTLTG